jgi:CheY-like chemotaxis protein
VVIEAEDAAGAMRQLADHPRIDLVLTDVVMPGEDGVTLAAQVRALRTGVRVGFMTGHADRERLAGEAVIDKPFREADLGEFVRGLLEGGSDSNQAGSEKL